MSNKTNYPIIFFIISDIIILILGIIIIVISAMISSKEYSFHKTLNLFLFQLIQSGLALILNIIMDIKIISTNYKGHNNYGMFIRFLNFYLNLSCVILTFQRSDNINQTDIQSLGNTILYVGLVNNLFIIISMILSFIVTDQKAFSKFKKEETERLLNINSLEQMELMEPDKSSGTTMRIN